MNAPLLAASVALKQRISSLTAEQRLQLLNKLQQGKSLGGGVDHSNRAIRKARPIRLEENSKVQVYPASAGQEQMWLLHHGVAGSPAYCVPSLFHLTGPVRLDWLEQSFREIIRRHDILRTTLRMGSGGLVQCVRAEMDFHLEELELHPRPEESPEATLDMCLGEAVCRPFDLTRGPLIRAMAVRLDPTETVLLVVLHHVVSDGWSRSVLYREFSEIYGRLGEGRTVEAREIPIQYADYSVWERDRRLGGELAAHEAYWKAKMAGRSEPLELPSDRQRPAVESFRGERCVEVLDASLLSSLKGLAQQEGATLFMVLLAAFKTLLFRYTGQRDLIVGVPTAHRRRLEVEGLIGYFVNTLPMRTEAAPDITFREMLRRTKETALEAFEHQDLAFEQLVTLLPSLHNGGRNSLFRTSFALQDFPPAILALPGVQARLGTVTTHTSKFDLSFLVEPSANGWSIVAEYCTELFEEARIRRMLGHWRTILVEVARDPALELGQLELLSKEERRRVLVEWNCLHREYAGNKCVHQLFEEQVKRSPDAVALVFEGKTLSYAQLNARANRLARQLRRFGAGPEVLVAICLERSLEMLIGVLGILKSGAAYVPIDPDYPEERIGFMLSDSKARIVITQPELRPRLDSIVETVISLDVDSLETGTGDEDNVESGVSGEHLAYVIYTSGSTGRPKGVLNTHRGVVNQLLWSQEQLPLTADDTLLQKTTFSFDISVWEFFCPLQAGARLVLARPQGQKDNAYLVRLVIEQRITLLQFVPSMLRWFLQEPEIVQCRSVRRVISGGEPLPVDLQDAFFERMPWAELHNLYGPTEAAVYATHYVCRRGLNLRTVPIGRPIANNELYILDERLKLVPEGVAGELHIGGIAVARGYLGRPELTSEKFIRDPFVADEGARLYRTGDLARHLPDGNIEYLGRMDHQVKVRGYRIELGEIESMLATHPGLIASGVLTKATGTGETELIGFIVRRPEVALSLEELRDWLMVKLPDYMVPARFEVVSSLPLTPNGKLDRKSLGKLVGDAIESRQRYVAPRDELERELVSIWQTTLRRELVGVEDNFFNIGGHSLLAAAIGFRIRERLGYEVPLHWILEDATVARLAKRISIHCIGVEALRIVRVERTELLPMSFAQQRMWFLRQTQPDKATYNVCIAWAFVGEVDAVRLKRALQEIQDRQEVLRTSLVEVEGDLLQRIEPIETVRLDWSECSFVGQPHEARAIPLEEFLRREARRPFDLDRAPLWRAVWIKLSAEEHVLGLCFHHAVIDEWSLRILAREVEERYAALGGGSVSPLAPLDIQYADFAVWQRNLWRGEIVKQCEAFWKEQLREFSAPLELPATRSRSLQPTGRGAVEKFRMSSAVVARFRELASEAGTTVFTVGLAAFQVWLRRYSGQGDITVGIPLSQRDRPELESVVGFFLNTLPIRARVNAESGFREVLKQVRDTLLGVFRHSTMPYEEIVKLAAAEQGVARLELCPVMFVLLEQEVEAPCLGTAFTRPVSMRTGTSKGDLILSIAAMGDEWECELEYSTDLFDEVCAARIVRHISELFCSIALESVKPVGELNMVSDYDRDQLASWNPTRPEILHEQCLHHWFETQVERTPEVLASVFGTDSLTYRELNQRANRIAHWLLRHGAGADTPVAICLESPMEMLAGILGILKSGSAYVPLNLSFPSELLAYMLRSSKAPVLLTQATLAGRFQISGCQALPIELLPAGLPDTNPGVPLTPRCLAYLLYTSGSTGQPKAVAMEHSPLLHLMRWQVSQSARPLRTLQFASFGFDVSFQEMFSTLLVGGTLVLVDRETQLDFNSLWTLIVNQRIERLFLPVAVLQRLAEVAERAHDRLDAVCEVTTAGEALRMTPDLLRFFTKRPKCSLHNHYGPTESHVVTSWTFPADRSAWPELPPIGRPIDGSRIHLLDSRLQPVPLGLPGEVYIGGASLARGYWDQPEKTEERFIADPFAATTGARLYRTGDLARYRDDGLLEFLGRCDHQIKIRGLRVEPGEIEVVLGRFEGVSASFVQVEQSSGGEKSLTAYLVMRADASVSGLVLRQWLEVKLPSFMIPSRFVLVPRLPLNVNGKVDRKQLEALKGTELPCSDGYLAARDEREQVLVEIWEQVLHRQTVGIRDNFFSLGGHSLLAASISALIKDRLGIAVRMHWILESGTIEHLAARIAANDFSTRTRSITRVDREQVIPMSFGQQGMWFLQQLHPHSASYNVGVAWAFTGDVDPLRIRWALGEIQRRHEVMRTALLESEGRLIQRVFPADEVPVPWEQIDLESLPEAQRSHALEEQLRVAARRVFDLSRPPLWRATYIRLAAQECVLAVEFHHGIVDEWSLRLMASELQLLYAHYGNIDAAQLPVLPIQYADYSVWQREHVSGQILERQLEFWKSQLAGLPPSLDLPTSRIRPLEPSGHGEVVRFQLEEAVVERLRALATESETTLFTVGLSAFFTWLSRYSGQDDIVVSTPISDRDRPEVQSLFGLFLNSIVIRARLSGSMSFRELLRQVRDTLVNSFDNADVPYEQVAQLGTRGRERGNQPLEQVIFVLLEEKVPGLRLGDARSHLLPVRNKTSKNDLLLSIHAVGACWECELEYAADIFDDSTAARMAGHLVELFRSIVQHPSRAMDQLNLLPEAEQQQILVDWNETTRVYPRNQCVHEVFEEQVQLTPESVAVVFGDSALSYRELNEQANRVAAQLRASKVGPGDLVALFVERSMEMVIALLGILKAGGVYWALEDNLPGERLSSMVENANPRLLLSTREEAPLLSQGLAAGGSSSCRRILIVEDLLSAELKQEMGHPTGCHAEQPAYVNYTSGSTGKPKGVLVPHRGVVRLVKNVEYVSLDATEVILHLSPLSFDASTFEIWGALLNGGKVVVMPAGVPTLGEIGEAIRQHGVTTLWLTAGLFHLMVDERLDELKPLRQLLAGGDVLSASHVRKARSALANCRIINGYGPTENTTFTCTYDVPPDMDGERAVPIGRPISNTQVYILDANRHPVPVGVPGELYAGGDGLACGYLGRPELTAERFVPNPFNPGNSERLYRTGDRARWLADGTIEFLGRMDTQTKIRGFRVEIGEIESVLEEHAGVSTCAVVVKESTGSGKYLCAFVVARDNAKLSEAEVRGWLGDRLPEYMVPLRVGNLVSMPLTPNGKLDRRALEKRELEMTAPVVVAEEVGNELEIQLAGIWEDVLGRKPIGLLDNFFKLGGTSLLAVKVQARVEKLLGIRMPLVALFQASTVKDLAALLSKPLVAAPGLLLTERTATRQRPNLFCLHHLTAAQRLARHLDPHWPVYGIESPLEDELRRWHTHHELTLTLEELAARNIAIIRSVQPKGPYLLAGFCFGGVLAFEVARQLEAQGEKIALLVLLDATYLPGVKKRSFPWLRRWAYHAQVSIGKGPGYLFEKIQSRMALARKRRSKLKDMFERTRAAENPEASGDRWPRADFMSRLLDLYQGQRYSGPALLIRTVEEPRSFTLDLGITSGWERVIQGEIVVEDMLCSHMDIAEEPFVGFVAQKILDQLAKGDLK